MTCYILDTTDTVKLTRLSFGMNGSVGLDASLQHWFNGVV